MLLKRENVYRPACFLYCRACARCQWLTRGTRGKHLTSRAKREQGKPRSFSVSMRFMAYPSLFFCSLACFTVVGLNSSVSSARVLASYARSQGVAVTATSRVLTEIPVSARDSPRWLCWGGASGTSSKESHRQPVCSPSEAWRGYMYEVTPYTSVECGVVSQCVERIPLRSF